MDESSQPNQADAVIVGGGLGGLAAACYLAEAGYSVTILEGRQHLGGLATTEERGGFYFNQGPHALYRGGAGIRVLTELGVQPQGRTPDTSAATMVRGGQAFRMPSNPLSLLRTSSLRMREKLEVARLLGRLPRMKPNRWAEVSTSRWLDRTTTSEAARELLEALIRTTSYCADTAKLSAEVAITQLQLGLGPSVLYLDRGWQQLIDQLTAKLEANPAVEIRRGQRVTGLPDSPVVLVAAGGPANAARLLESDNTEPWGPLGPPATASCLDLGLSRPPDFNLVLGLDRHTYVSNHSAVADLAPPGMYHVSAMAYSPQQGRDYKEIRNELEAFTLHAWQKAPDLAGITVQSRYLHEMTASTSIAIAANGGLTGRPTTTDSGHNNVFLIGDWVGPEGHLADATLASAKSAAHAAIVRLERRTVR